FAHFIRTPAFTLGRPGQPLAEGLNRPGIFIQSIDGYSSHVRVLAGTLPQPVSSGGAVPELQVAVSARGADRAGVKAGDHILLGDSFDDCERHPPDPNAPPDPPCTPHATVVSSVPALVTAIVEPADPKDPFWAGSIDDYFVAPPP